MHKNPFHFATLAGLVVFLSLLGGLIYQLQSPRVTASQIPLAMEGRRAPSAPVAEGNLSHQSFLKASPQQMAYGQVPSREQMNLPSQRLALAPERLPVTKRLAPIEIPEQQRRKTQNVAVTRAATLSTKDIAHAGITQTNDEGKTVQLITLESPNAIELRVHFTDFNLAEGEAVYVYGSDSDGPAYGPYTGRGMLNRGGGSGDFWSGVIAGERAVISLG